MSIDASEQKRAIKRERNRQHYLKSKTGHDIILLRLDKGDIARLDAASKAASLSRAAFVRMHLMPLVDAYSARADSVDRKRTSRGQSLETFLGRAIDSALAQSDADMEPDASGTAASEFDALFSSD